MELKIVNELPEDVWRGFVDQHPSANIFHTPEMFQVFSKTVGHLPLLMAATQGEQLIALLPSIQISLAEGALRAFTTRAVAYGSLLCASGQENIYVLEEFILKYVHQTGKRILFTEFRNLSDYSFLQPVLKKVGFRFEDHINYIVDLELSEEQVWRNISKSARKDIRKAERIGSLSIQEIDNKQMITQWYSVLQKSFKWNNAYLADISLFENAYDVLYPKHMIQFLICKLGARDVAVSVALLYKGTIYGWYRGFDRHYASHYPNDLMIWHLFKWGLENGFTCFDFGGAGKPNEEYGPRVFKKKFGGRLVNYGRNYYIHSPIRLKLSAVGYKLLRRFL